MTANQMKYLLTFLRQEKERGQLSSVAHICGVNKSTVSRALSACVEEGILNARFKLTKYGEEYTKRYIYRYDQLTLWMCKNGVNRETAKSDAYVMLEHCSEDTIKMMGQAGEFCKACESFKRQGQKTVIKGSDLCEYLSEGEYNIPFIFHKERKRGPEQISMANEAFEHPGVMIIKKNNSRLCLKAREMKQPSLIAKFSLQGKVRTIKYEDQGQVREVQIDDDMAYIPLTALKFLYIKEDNILQGHVRLTMTCTAGTIHMPESPALLTIYL